MPGWWPWDQKGDGGGRLGVEDDKNSHAQEGQALGCDPSAWTVVENQGSPWE